MLVYFHVMFSPTFELFFLIYESKQKIEKKEISRILEYDSTIGTRNSFIMHILCIIFSDICILHILYPTYMHIQFL